MDAVRRGGIFEHMLFEEADKALFPQSVDTMKTKFHEAYGEEIYLDAFNADDVKVAIRMLNAASAPGLSGISYAHLKHLKEKGAFAENFSHFANKMLKASALVEQLPTLYKVRVILIKKDEAGRSKRPIQIAESFLRLFHKMIVLKM
jgi:hypothetical protein